MAIGNNLGVRVDPASAYNFLITFVDSSSVLATAVSQIQTAALGGFSECAGLEMSLKIEEYPEGGRNETSLKFPTRVSWTNLILKRGVTGNPDLWDWHYGFVEGRGKRRDGIIVLQNDLHLPVNIWTFKRGIPVKWTGPALNASQSAVAIESIEIAHEGLRQAPPVGLASAALGAAA
jgi:phage tail-like protein